MKRMIKYPSIEQFRNIVKKVQEKATYVGKDSDGNAIFDILKPKPTLTFSCSEKIHGTNAGVCYSNSLGLWVQSRERIITPESDNMGFAFYVSQNEEAIIKLIKELAIENYIDLDSQIISLYGEWAGGNIQKNSALTGYEKVFILFEHFKVSPVEPSEEEKAVWVKTITQVDAGILESSEKFNTFYTWAESPENKIFNIMNFETYRFSIDFNNPEKGINDIISLVDEIEQASPLGKHFGFDNNIGEGVVCSYLSFEGELLQFKVKGDKHSNSKVIKTPLVDTEKLSKVEECLAKIIHNWRFEQGLTEVYGSDYENNLDRTKLGEYLKWVANDTLKEESDIISEYGLEPKDVLGKVSAKAKEYYYLIENKS